MTTSTARNVLVPASALEAARQILLETEATLPSNRATDRPTASRVGLGLLVGVAVVAATVWLGTGLAF
ncbi:MAG TPA: hypothetical protein VG474_09785 [Solirubrobacteraceae bacterium]|nr:hypothetical protein [Solirubrobacteraceae bacterium]